MGKPDAGLDSLEGMVRSAPPMRWALIALTVKKSIRYEGERLRVRAGRRSCEIGSSCRGYRDDMSSRQLVLRVRGMMPDLDFPTFQVS